MAYLNGNKILMGANVALANLPIDQTYKPESENAQSGKAVAQAVANLGGGKTWRLIRDDTLTEQINQYKVKNDTDGNALALKKVMIEVYADTTQGAYPSSGNILFQLCQLNLDQYWAKTLWATAPMPTTAGKVSYIRIDAEVIGENAFTTVSTQKNAEGFAYTQLGAASTVIRSQAFPLQKENIGMFTLDYGNGLHIGTRIVVWGVDA